MMLSFLLLLALITKSLSVFYDGLSNELRFIHHEIGSLKDENYKHNMEIASLKETVQLQNKTINRQEKTIIQLSIENQRMLFKNGRPVSSAAQYRRKRPVRILPDSILFGKKKNETDQPILKRFYGPPTNCSDLTRLGYTLNGYYLVKNPALSDDVKKTTKIETVYCAFKQEQPHNPLLVQQEVIPPPSYLNPLTSSTFSTPPPKLDQEIFKTTNAMVFTSTTSTFSTAPKLDQEIFKATNASVVFNSTSTTTLIKGGDQSSCIPLWQLKIGEKAYIQCLTVLPEMSIYREYNLTLRKCEDRQLAEGQKWSMVESENAGVRICQEQWNQCVTFSPHELHYPLSQVPNIYIKKREEKSKSQLFKMNNETSQIMIVESGSCLGGVFRRKYVGLVTVLACNETTGEETTDDDPRYDKLYKKWSPVPLNNCL